MTSARRRYSQRAARTARPASWTCCAPRAVALLVEPEWTSEADQLGPALLSADWDVCVVRSAAEAYDRLPGSGATLVVSHLALSDESGWLLAAKLMLAQTGCRVWLFSKQRDPLQRLFAEFVGVDRLVHDGEELRRAAFSSMPSNKRSGAEWNTVQ
jgi:hypothetical protein